MRKYRIRRTTIAIEESARTMRFCMTHSEQTLWSKLSNRQLDGFKFRRQHPAGRFIFDFYCPSQKLVIEIDGDSHINRKVMDRVRDSEIGSFGYRVIRFSADEIENNIESVIREIRSELIKPLNPQ
jgi:very-short-patch-repair endonuclease